MNKKLKLGGVFALLASAIFTISYTSHDAQAQATPSFHFDPTWPKPLPNLWKLGGVTGLAVDSNDNVWVYNRPNDAMAVELRAEPSPPIARCCVRPPSMIHLDIAGNVIGSFDAPQGHGMDVDDDGFFYLGQDTVRKYDPSTGALVAEVRRTPERENRAAVGLFPVGARAPGEPSRGPVTLLPPSDPAEAAAAVAAFRAKYHPETPMIVGGLEEMRIVEEDNEMYVADNSTGGVAFSPDADQQYLYISDLTNNTLWFLNRDTGELVAEMGNMGDRGGEFYGLHMIAVDSDGNIYTGEVQQGERVQRFVPSESTRGQLLQRLENVP